MSIPVFFDGHDVGVSSQDLHVIIGEASSKTADDVPFMRDIRMKTEFVENRRGTGETIIVVFVSHNVPSGNRVFGLPNRGKGGRSGKSWEKGENEWDEPLEEHDGLGQ